MIMEEELTSLMHMEFCLNEQERIEIAAMAVYAEVFNHKSISFDKALIKYSISEEQFYENMPSKHIFTFAERSLDDLRKSWPDFSKEKHEKYKACKDKFETCRLFEEIHIA